MRLTNFTDYSLRVLLHLACAPEGKATIAEVAEAYGISENHLVKVVHFLGTEGFLENVRGRGGGLRLARAAREIEIGKVVRLTEGGDRPAECFDPATNRCPITRVCRLAGVLDEAVEAFYGVLGNYTLEDLVRNRPKIARILFHPRAA